MSAAYNEVSPGCVTKDCTVAQGPLRLQDGKHTAACLHQCYLKLLPGIFKV